MKVSVSQGDTLHKLLRERGVPENKLQEASEQVAQLNQLASPDVIQAGSTLLFPDQMTFGSETVALNPQPSAYEHLAAQGTASSGQAMGAMGRFAFTATAREAEAQADKLTEGLKTYDPNELRRAADDAENFFYSDAAKQIPSERRQELRAALGHAYNRLEDISGLGRAGLVEDTEHRVSMTARYKMSTTSASGTDSVTNHAGEKLDLAYNNVSLKVTDRESGGVRELDSNRQMVEGYRLDFKEMAADYDMGWDVDAGFTPAGDLGKMVSATRSDSGFSGGAHPNANTVYKTFNAETGEQVKLSDLLTEGEFKSVMRKGEETLRTDPEHEAFIWSGSSGADLAEALDQSFALFMSGGRPKIALGKSHSVEAARGLMLEAVVDAPCTPEFFAKVGLDHAKVASDALYPILDAGTQVNPELPYRAIDFDQVTDWFGDFYGKSAAKLSPEQREAAASALEDFGMGVYISHRMAVHQMAEEIRSGDYKIESNNILPVEFNQDEEAFFKSRDMLWGNSFFIDSGNDFGPAVRYDFEPGGKLSGWTLDMSGDMPTRKRFEGEYNINNNGVIDIVAGGEQSQLQLTARAGEFGLATKDGKALDTRPDYGATAEEEPSVALLERPFWAPAMGAYGHTAKLMFEPGGDFHGWRQAYDEVNDIHQKPVSGKWSFDDGKVTLKLDEPIDGKSAFEGVLTDKGPKFPDSPFADMTAPTEFWDA